MGLIPGRGIVILRLDPSTVTHSGCGQAFAVRHWIGFAWSGFFPAAVCPVTGRVRGLLAYVRIRVASGKQGIQHGETGEDHGVHGAERNLGASRGGRWSPIASLFLSPWI